MAGIDEKDALKITLEGRIDSNNAPKLQERVDALMAGNEGHPVIFDAENLEYISSAGLRVLLRVRNRQPDITIVNVNSEVYEVFEMTGFSEIMKVEKAFRTISVEGCTLIGRGSNGSIYKVGNDIVVKVYTNRDALDSIRHEREMSRLALVKGLPTAISFDIVKVGDSYASVFELLNAVSFSWILTEQPEKMDWCVREYVRILKQIHGTDTAPGELPDMRQTALSWADYLKDHFPEDKWNKLHSLIEAVPPDTHMLHGDYHTQNLMLQKDEVLLIDMDTLAAGNPVFELASMYNAFVGFSEVDHEIVRKFQGFSRDVSIAFWHKALAAYLDTDDPDKVRDAEDKARIIGYTRLIRRALRRDHMKTDLGRAEIFLWREELFSLLDKYDTLLIG